jgi:hypothetical protein
MSQSEGCQAGEAVPVGPAGGGQTVLAIATASGHQYSQDADQQASRFGH